MVRVCAMETGLILNSRQIGDKENTVQTTSRQINPTYVANMVMPPSWQFDGSDLSFINQNQPTDYAKWWYIKMRDVNTVIENILRTQGMDNHTKPAPLELSTFRPVSEFAWIHLTPDLQKFFVGDIDDCAFRQMDGHEVFVPSGWAIAVMKTVRNFGVVSVCNADRVEKPVWGMRWNNERFNLVDTGYGWRK